MDTIYTNLKKLNEKHGDVEYRAEIPTDVMKEVELHTLTELASTLKIPGFRQGKVPETIARQHISEMEVLEHAAREILREAMESIASDEQLDVLGRPEVTITKLAPGNPLEFKVRYALFPDISLPDYKKIGREIWERKESTEVEEKDIDEAILRIQTMILPPDAPKDVTPPPLTDESVKQFGPFATLADFRNEVKRQLAQEKEFSIKDAKHDEIIKEVVSRAKVKIPPSLIEQEYSDLVYERNAQIEAMKISFEEYLKQLGKTEEALEKESRGLIEENIKTSLVIQEIRKKEDINPHEREIQVNIARLKLRYPEETESSLRRTAEALLVQERLFAILEGTEKKIEEHAADPRKKERSEHSEPPASTPQSESSSQSE